MYRIRIRHCGNPSVRDLMVTATTIISSNVNKTCIPDDDDAFLQAVNDFVEVFYNTVLNHSHPTTSKKLRDIAWFYGMRDFCKKQ
jgi:hypothetical protein